MLENRGLLFLIFGGKNKMQTLQTDHHIIRVRNCNEMQNSGKEQLCSHNQIKRNH